MRILKEWEKNFSTLILRINKQTITTIPTFIQRLKSESIHAIRQFQYTAGQ